VSSQPGHQQQKSEKARQAICDAAISSLAEVGYSDTSLNRVASAAGFSKGALQHHFPNKEDLIAATVDKLLLRTFHTTSRNPPNSVSEALMQAWSKYINTPAYRALMEILSAARTDKPLQLRISGQLKDWGRRMDRQSLEQYEAVSGDPDDVIALINMNRSFMRGLLIQEQYGITPEAEQRYVEKWIELISPQLRLRTVDSNAK